MANLMENPIEWRKREIDRLTVANALRKHWKKVESQNVVATMLLRNLKMQLI